MIISNVVEIKLRTLCSFFRELQRTFKYNNTSSSISISFSLLNTWTNSVIHFLYTSSLVSGSNFIKLFKGHHILPGKSSIERSLETLISLYISFNVERSSVPKPSIQSICENTSFKLAFLYFVEVAIRLVLLNFLLINQGSFSFGNGFSKNDKAVLSLVSHTCLSLKYSSSKSHPIHHEYFISSLDDLRIVFCPFSKNCFIIYFNNLLNSSFLTSEDLFSNKFSSKSFSEYKIIHLELSWSLHALQASCK